MKLLLVSDGSFQVVTPNEIREVIGYMIENHTSLPEFVTEVVTIHDDSRMSVCADVYAKHNRLPRRICISPIVDQETLDSVDALIFFGDTEKGAAVCALADKLKKPCLILPFPTPPELGVMTGINADGERVELSLEEQEKLDTELMDIRPPTGVKAKNGGTSFSAPPLHVGDMQVLSDEELEKLG